MRANPHLKLLRSELKAPKQSAWTCLDPGANLKRENVSSVLLTFYCTATFFSHKLISLIIKIYIFAGHRIWGIHFF